MANIDNSLISNISYTNKDFQTIFPELLELAKKLTNKWDPSQSNESDPGVLLLKLLAIIADKNDYNIDKNILECFPASVTQDTNARQLFEELGYNMQWYKSAITNSISMQYIGEKDVNTDIILPAFTSITNEKGDIIYTLLGKQDKADNTKYMPVNIPKSGEQITLSAIEGTIFTYVTTATNIDNQRVTLSNIDENNRIYFSQDNIAENGIFIMYADDYYDYKNTYDMEPPINNWIDWKKVDNLAVEQLGNKIYKFGVSPNTKKCYIEFPSDISSIIQNGLIIKYILSSGNEGNIALQQLTKFYNTNTFKTITYDDNNIAYEGEDTVLDETNFSMYNTYSILNGDNPENIDDAYKNYQKTIGVFNTLVTLRDYMNRINVVGNNSELSSNCIVTDRTNDIQNSYNIKTLNKQSLEENYLQIEQQSLDNETPTQDKLNAFDLKLYLLSYTANPRIKEASDRTFELITNEVFYEMMEGLIDEDKSIQHNFKSFEHDKICLFKNKYYVNCNIIPTSRLSEKQIIEIRSNINSKLYSMLNSQKINFGEEISYDYIYDLILNCDDRIKAISLEPLKYYTYAVYVTQETVENSLNQLISSYKVKEICINDIDSDEVYLRVYINQDSNGKYYAYRDENYLSKLTVKEIQNKLLFNKNNDTLANNTPKYKRHHIYTYKEIDHSANDEGFIFEEYSDKYDDFRNEIYAKSVLAGKTQLYNPDTQFDYNIGQLGKRLITNVKQVHTNTDIYFNFSNSHTVTATYSVLNSSSGIRQSFDIGNRFNQQQILTKQTHTVDMYVGSTNSNDISLLYDGTIYGYLPEAFSNLTYLEKKSSPTDNNGVLLYKLEPTATVKILYDKFTKSVLPSNDESNYTYHFVYENNIWKYRLGTSGEYTTIEDLGSIGITMHPLQDFEIDYFINNSFKSYNSDDMRFIISDTAPSNWISKSYTKGELVENKIILDDSWKPCTIQKVYKIDADNIRTELVSGTDYEFDDDKITISAELADSDTIEVQGSIIYYFTYDGELKSLFDLNSISQPYGNNENIELRYNYDSQDGYWYTSTDISKHLTSNDWKTYGLGNSFEFFMTKAKSDSISELSDIKINIQFATHAVSYKLKDNENIVFSAPNYITKASYGGNTKIEYNISSTVPANTSYALTGNDYFIFYWKTGENNSHYQYKKYTADSEFNIIRPNFSLNTNSVLFGNGANSFATSLPEGSGEITSTGREQIISNSYTSEYVLSNQKSIDIVDKNSVSTQDQKFYGYWQTNIEVKNLQGKLGYKLPLQFEPDPTNNGYVIGTYTLQDNEYFVKITDNNTSFELFGSGTLIKYYGIQLDDNSLICEKIDLSNIMIERQSLFTNADVKKLAGDIYNFWVFTEMQIIAIGPESVINITPNYSVEQVNDIVFTNLGAFIADANTSQIHNTPVDFNKYNIQYQSAGEEETHTLPLLQINENEDWFGRSILNINCNKKTSQTLYENQTITFVNKDSGIDGQEIYSRISCREDNGYIVSFYDSATGEDIEFKDNVDKYLQILSEYPVQILGGNNIDVTPYDNEYNSFYLYYKSNLNDKFDTIGNVTIKLDESSEPNDTLYRNDNTPIEFSLPKGNYILPVVNNNNAFNKMFVYLSGDEHIYDMYTPTIDIDGDDDDYIGANIMVGDVDGDGIVDIKDSTYLLYHVFFGDTYPITQHCNFSTPMSTEKATSDDAIFLGHALQNDSAYNIPYLGDKNTISFYNSEVAVINSNDANNADTYYYKDENQQLHEIYKIDSDAVGKVCTIKYNGKDNHYLVITDSIFLPIEGAEIGGNKFNANVKINTINNAINDDETGKDIEDGIYYYQFSIINDEYKKCNLIFNCISSSMSGDKVIKLLPLFKYDNIVDIINSTKANTDVVTTQAVIDTLQKLDLNHKFNYTHIVSDDEKIDYPLDSQAFLNKSHIYNKFTICQLNNINDTIINNMR